MTAGTAASRGPFVGRSSELARLRLVICGAGHEPALAIVAGEAGVGKSRLVAEALREPLPIGCRVLRGACVASSRDVVPLAPILESLRELVATLPPGDRRRRLEDVLSGRGHAVRPRSGHAGLPLMVLDGLLAATGRQPTVLVIDDLHWADGATLGLVEHLARNVPAERVTVVVTLRQDRATPVAVTRLLGELVRRDSVHYVELRPLELAEVSDLVRATWGRAVDDQVIRRVARRSHGLPLYVEAILASPDRTARALPVDLHAIIAGTLAGITQDERSVLATLSAAAEPLLLSMIVDAGSRSIRSAESALSRLVADGLVVEVDGRWAVRHALIAEVALANLDRGEQRRIQLGLAGALRSAASGPDDTLAAERRARAARHAARGGDRRAALADHAIAAELALDGIQSELGIREARLALRIAREDPTLLPAAGRDLVAIERTAARAEHVAGRPRASDDLLTSARAHAEAAGDAQAVIDIDMLRLVVLGQLGDGPSAGDVAERLYRDADRLGMGPVQRCRVANTLASCRGMEGRPREALALAREALALALAAGEHEMTVEAQSNLGTALVDLGEDEEGVALLREAWRGAREHRVMLHSWGRMDPTLPIYALANVAWYLAIRGEWHEARAIADWTLAGAPVDRATREGSMMHAIAIMPCFQLGRWPDAVRHVGRAMGFGERYTETIALTHLARIQAGAGRTERAALSLDRARRLQSGWAEPSTPLQLAIAAADIAWYEGRREGVRAAVSGGIPRAEVPMTTRRGAIELHAIGLSAEAATAPGRRLGRARTEGRDRWRDVAIERARDAIGDVTPRLPADDVTWAWVERCHAEIARLKGHDDADAWRDLGDRWLASEAPVQAAYAYLCEADAVGVGGSSRSGSALAQAHELCRPVPARMLAWRIERVATDLGMALTRPMPRRTRVVDPGAHLLADLTPREREVARLVAAGGSNRSIAGELQVTEKTAAIHVSNILGKLGLERRGEIAALMYRAGIAEGP